MHATDIINNYLGKHCQSIHKTRREALMAAVQALIQGKSLTVTGLGRALAGHAYVKHAIKRMDRLVGNLWLHRERGMVYGALARWLLANTSHPVILIDWSDLTSDREYHILRASTPVGGRALTVYEEVHSIHRLTKPGVHNRFLHALKRVLPEGSRPIVVTDAGFRAPWFRMIKALDWDWVGRVRNRDFVTPYGCEDWLPCKSLYEQATARPKYIGHARLVRSNPFPVQLYLMRHQKQDRVKRTAFGQRCESRHSEKNAQREREPWLIATSLNGGRQIASRVMNLYRTRMQIEEAFRDIKNPRYGFSLRHSNTRAAYRFENMLLIGALATLAIWLIGKAAQMKQLHRHFQANTVRSRNVLSIFYLGSQIIRQDKVPISISEIKQALNELRCTIDKVCLA